MAMVTWRWRTAKGATAEFDRAESNRLRQEMLHKSAKLDEWVLSLRMQLETPERPDDDRSASW